MPQMAIQALYFTTWTNKEKWIRKFLCDVAWWLKRFPEIFASGIDAIEGGKIRRERERGVILRFMFASRATAIKQIVRLQLFLSGSKIVVDATITK